MPRLLVCTVGGSPQPVVNALRQNAHETPLDHVFFLCSSSARGSGSDEMVEQGVAWKTRVECPKCGATSSREVKHAPIARQAGLPPGSYTIESVDDPDDLRQVVEACERIDRVVGDQWPGGIVIANYTGGTKTMSFGLGLYALRRDWMLQINATGQGRDNLLRIKFGDVALAQEGGWLARREVLERAADLETQHHYGAAVAILEALAAGQQLESAEREELLEALNRCRMLAAWDRFDYSEALRWARQSSELAGRHAAHLSGIARAAARLRGEVDGRLSEDAALALIEDLRDNARRCVSKARYDDAVGRLYRSTEMVAQIRLLAAYGLRTEDLDLSHPAIPESTRQRLLASGDERRRRVKISLVAAYELLAEMNDALGRYFAEHLELLRWLEVRNNSLFAHGLEPIGAARWSEVGAPWEAWLDGAMAILRGSESGSPAERPSR